MADIEVENAPALETQNGQLEPTLGEDTESAEAPEVEAVALVSKPIYVVRTPRPDIDETSQKVLQQELDLYKNKVKLLNDHLNIKRGEKEAAFQSTQEAREQLRAVQKDRQNLLDQLQPLRDARKTVQADLSAHKDEKRDLSVRSEEELDRMLVEMEFKISHETLSLNEEKQLMKDMKKLESQRERVREVEAKAGNVGLSQMEKEKLHGSIKHLESQLDLIRLEEKTQQEIFQKFRDEEREIEDQMKGIKEERAEVSALKDALHDKLRGMERESRRKLKAFYDVKRLITKCKDLMADGRWDEAQQFALNHNEAVHTKLEEDKSYNQEYCRLLEKNRRMPMIPNMEEEDDWEEAQAGSKSTKVDTADMEAKAKAKAADLIAQLLGEAEEEVASRKRAVAREPVPAPEPEPEPEPVPLKPAPKQSAKSKSAAPPVAMPELDMEKTYAFEAPQPEAKEENLSAAEQKELARQHNMAASKEAADRKAKREQAAAKRKAKAEEAARHKAVEAAQRAEAVEEEAAPVAAAPDTDEETEEKAAPSAQKAAMPAPPKRPRKNQKGVVPAMKKMFKDNETAVYVAIAGMLFLTLLHYYL